MGLGPFVDFNFSFASNAQSTAAQKACSNREILTWMKTNYSNCFKKWENN